MEGYKGSQGANSVMINNLGESKLILRICQFKNCQ